MPLIKDAIRSFTSGELDPLMKGRSDTEFYYSGLQTARNVLIIPEGGAKRRPGLEYIDRLHRQVTRETSPVISTPRGGTGSNANDDDLTTELITTTNISTLNPYVAISYDLGSAKSIAFVDVVNAKLTSATNATEFFIQVSTDNVTWTSVGGAISMSASAITERRRVRGSYRYVRFARIGSTDLGTDKVTLAEFNVWTETATLSAARLVPFEFNIEQSYMLLFTDKNIAVYKDGVHQIDVRANSYTSDKLSTLNWCQSNDTAIFFQEDIQPYELKRGSSDALWTFTSIIFDFIPKYNFVPATSNPAATLTPSAVSGTITLTAGAAVFSAGNVNQYIEGNGGRARILSFTSTTVVTAVVEIPFYSAEAIASGSWTLETGWEDVWSTTRGWPRSGTFHEEALWFGGSKSRPHTIWRSRIGEFYDFDPGAIQDDDAINATLNTAQVNAIVNIVSGRSLQIFTTGGEFAVLQSLNEPVTPRNVNVKQQTSEGSEPGIQALDLEGATLYLKRNGGSLNQFVYSEAEGAYTTANISLLASHIVISPVDMAVRKSTNTEEATYVLGVNSDGTLFTCCSLRGQNVKAFTLCTTDGSFKNVGVDIEDMYFVVERTINGSVVRYLERFNLDHYTDCSKRITTGLPASTFTGLDHLEGEECRVKADGSVMDNESVTGGSITIDRNATDYVEVGLDFNPTITTLPYENPQLGVGIGSKKRISKVILRLYETGDITVNNNKVSFRRFGLSGGGTPLGSAPPIFTGDKVVEGIRGWDDFGQVTITQTDPLPMTILAIGIKVMY